MMKKEMKKDPKVLFKLEGLKKGCFVQRFNRFAGEIEYNGKIESAHIHDPGRLEELLSEGVEVLFTNSNGKLKYYIKAVKKKGEWVLLDSALHSKIALKVFKHLPEFSSIENIRKEVPLGNSRIDFLLDGTPLEVKGVSLVKNKVAFFPDAPTKRGQRHVREIIEHDGILLFLILRSATEFVPNAATDPEFTQLLSEARKQEIPIIPVQISFDGNNICYEGKIRLGVF
ncbi:MAG: DNA/RNA nuclease SfsA [Candidatus Lokiarchaeota archaeon]|nr:DNA/RNA nuclease SfsA [Candidatus Lokiarchaeota archaeon]MBD3201528.1 DNA/RNA nuclease SfsA [Candidatus Lokiarchaeota archaeon]